MLTLSKAFERDARVAGLQPGEVLVTPRLSQPRPARRKSGRAAQESAPSVSSAPKQRRKSGRAAPAPAASLTNELDAALRSLGPGDILVWDLEGKKPAPKRRSGKKPAPKRKSGKKPAPKAPKAPKRKSGKTVQCLATTVEGRRCKNRTARGAHCTIHTR